MRLLPLDSPALLELAARWLEPKETHQWLDFGNGGRVVTPALLRIMSQRETHFMRMYTADQGDAPAGIVAMNNVDRVAKTATLWALAGDKTFSHRGYVSLATSRFLTLAFRDLGLHAVNTWIVDGNPSLRSLQRLNFRFVGRLRQCHPIEGRPRDRLLFDLLASEHRELDEARWSRIGSAHREAVG